MMKMNLGKYNLVSKILVGDRLKIVFEDKYEMDEKRVLELNGIAGYFDATTAMPDVKFLSIDGGGGAYAIDLSARLARPEVARYAEVYLFTDADGIGFSFHAVASSANFRYFEEDDAVYR